jgi:hypothetical protein
VSCQGFNFCGAVLVKQHGDVEIWRVIVVYGSPYEETKVDCIQELHQVMESWKGPTLLGGGDFNLIGTQEEKNNGIVNFTHASIFNDWIKKWGLMEINDPSRLYTWSNNQDNPIMAKIDRILVSVN